MIHLYYIYMLMILYIYEYDITINIFSNIYNKVYLYSIYIIVSNCMLFKYNTSIL